MAKNKVCNTPKKEERHALMLVSPIEEKTEMEGLSRDGETEEAQEDEEKEEESMSDCCPVSKDQEGGEEEKEKEDSCEGRTSVGRKPPNEPTKVEKEERERTHCPYRSWCEHCVRARSRNGDHRSSTPVEPL